MEDTTTPASIGHNLPPEETAPEQPAAPERAITLDPDQIAANLEADNAKLLARVETLLHGDPAIEGSKGFDGLPDVIEDETTAEKATALAGMVRRAMANAEAARKANKVPFDQAASAVQGFFMGRAINPLKAALDVIERRGGVYLRAKQKREDDERREREMAARLAAEEAARVAEAALEAATSPEPADYGDPDPADQARLAAAAEAHAAELASQAERAGRPTGTTKVQSAAGTSMSLRAPWVVAGVDMETVDLEALRPYLSSDDVMKAARKWLSTHKDAVIRGDKKLKGATIEQDFKARSRG